MVGNGDSSPSTSVILSSTIVHVGVVDVSNAAVAAYEHASKRFAS